jgi:hypothetical protein
MRNIFERFDYKNKQFYNDDQVLTDLKNCIPDYIHITRQIIGSSVKDNSRTNVEDRKISKKLYIVIKKNGEKIGYVSQAVVKKNGHSAFNIRQAINEKRTYKGEVWTVETYDEKKEYDFKIIKE